MSCSTPTTPSPAFAFGEKTGDPLAMYLEDIFTVTVNMAGLPGISVPAGLSSEGHAGLGYSSSASPSTRLRCSARPKPSKRGGRPFHRPRALVGGAEAGLSRRSEEYRHGDGEAGGMAGEIGAEAALVQTRPERIFRHGAATGNGMRGHE